MSHAIYEITTALALGGVVADDEHLSSLLADGWEPYSVTWEQDQRIVHLRRVVRYT